MTSPPKGYLIAQLRRAWLRSPERTKALQRARIERGKYQCAECLQAFKRQQVQVDHKQEIGSWRTYDEMINRLFCDADGLQVLCKACHKAKTNKFMKARKHD